MSPLVPGLLDGKFPKAIPMLSFAVLCLDPNSPGHGVIDQKHRLFLTLNLKLLELNLVGKQKFRRPQLVVVNHNSRFNPSDKSSPRHHISGWRLLFWHRWPQLDGIQVYGHNINLPRACLHRQQRDTIRCLCDLVFIRRVCLLYWELSILGRPSCDRQSHRLPALAANLLAVLGY